MTWVLNISFRVRIRLPRMAWSKRKNRILCEMARMMLDEHRTPRRFWAEAANTMCYVSIGSTSESTRRKHVIS
jgi:hypothetical protein